MNKTFTATFYPKEAIQLTIYFHVKGAGKFLTFDCLVTSMVHLTFLRWRRRGGRRVHKQSTLWNCDHQPGRKCNSSGSGCRSRSDPGLHLEQTGGDCEANNGGSCTNRAKIPWTGNQSAFGRPMFLKWLKTTWFSGKKLISLQPPSQCASAEFQPLEGFSKILLTIFKDPEAIMDGKDVSFSLHFYKSGYLKAKITSKSFTKKYVMNLT